jgi:hypothetical protein
MEDINIKGLVLVLYNMVEQTMITLGVFENIQVTYGILRPILAGGSYTEKELYLDENNMYNYRGKYYSDFRVEIYDSNKHKDVEMIKNDAPTYLCENPQTYELVKDIIAKLKEIDVDGETMEHILEQVGMDKQMLRQLVMSSTQTDVIDLLEERIELDNQGLSAKNGGDIVTPEKRLGFIKDDVESIRKVINANDPLILEMSAHPECEIGRLLNDIEIACDLNDDEPKGWI